MSLYRAVVLLLPLVLAVLVGALLAHAVAGLALLGAS